MASNRLETRMTETKTLMISYACDWYSQDLRLSYVITGNLVAKNTHSRADVATASEKNRATTLRNAATGQYLHKYYVQQRLLLDWKEINSMVFPDTVSLEELLQHMISCLETIKSRLKFYRLGYGIDDGRIRARFRTAGRRFLLFPVHTGPGAHQICCITIIVDNTSGVWMRPLTFL